MSVRKNIPASEDGGDELGLERNGDDFEGGQGPEKAVAPEVIDGNNSQHLR